MKRNVIMYTLSCQICFVSFFRQRWRSLWEQGCNKAFFKVWTLLEIDLFKKSNVKQFPTPPLHVQIFCWQIPDLEQEKFTSIYWKPNVPKSLPNDNFFFKVFLNKIPLAAAYQVLTHSLVILVPVYSDNFKAVFSIWIMTFKFFWEFPDFLISHMSSGSRDNTPILNDVR